MLSLVQNELLKLWRKRRWLVVVLIMTFLIPLLSYSSVRQAEQDAARLGTSDWRVMTQEKILATEQKMQWKIGSEQRQQQLAFQAQRLQYCLDHDINPNLPGAYTATLNFFSLASTSTFILPCLIAILIADIVSGEYRHGTIQNLLTSPHGRLRILASKGIASVLAVSLLLLIVVVLTFCLSGLFVGYKGFDQPTPTRLLLEGGILNTDEVTLWPQVGVMGLAVGTAWLSALVFAAFAFLTSTLLRNAAVATTILLLGLVSGSLLVSQAPNWELLRYLPFPHLNLTNYIGGQALPLPNMSFLSSLGTLSLWALAAIVASAWVFKKRDVNA